MHHPVNRVPPTAKGVKMQPAVCTKCGREGKSQKPEFYICSVCYHEANAEGCVRRAEELEARAARFRQEAARHREQAAAYRERWDTPKKKS